MLTVDQAINLLRKYDLSESRIAHCQGVASFAYDLALRIHQNNPTLQIDPEKVQLAALLHDIGRSQPGDHERNTVEILKSEGLYELAEITMHGSYYEIMLLRGVDDSSLLPHTIENKIVAYADTRFREHPVSMKERWEEIEQRRKKETIKIESLQMAKPRFIEMEKELMRLANESDYI